MMSELLWSFYCEKCPWSIQTGLLYTECTLFLKNRHWDVPEAPVAKTLPSSAGHVGWIHGLGAKSPHASWPKKPEHKQQKQNTVTDLMVALVVKKPPANAGDVTDMGLIPELGRSPGGGHGNPLQYSCLEDPMDRGARWAAVHGVAHSRTPLKQLSTY